ncbi:cyclopropane-fatty-acyl-phospholipid synthase [Xylariaceae sp. FL1651]|nr:cyclopropane-fatty-acyl-phospholipid synthase [Xylariaceae sp. FL1651]
MAHSMNADPPFSSIRYLPTNEAYDRWAEYYDTDGNFLQAMDDVELKTLFPRFLASISSPRPWRIVDMGCGTGRNTSLLLGVPEAEVIALDASKGMLEAAKSRLLSSSLTPEVVEMQNGTAKSRPLAYSPLSNQPNIRFEIFDMLATSSSPVSVEPYTADAIISTLVVEHIPLPTFFAHVSQLLRPGGVLLLTNMHAHMGGISQAGFVDILTGEKIRPTSYAHTVEDTVLEAQRWGLEVESNGDGTGISERIVTEDMIEKLGLRSQKWIGITCWFGGLFRKTAC